jgi:hypothetical protein
MGLWMFGLVMDSLVRPRTVGSPFLVSTFVIEGVAVVVSGLLFAYLRFTTHPPRIQAHAGLVFMVLNAMGVGLLNTWARPLTADALNELSWNTIVILCGAMLMPATPKQMLVAALLSASMDPLGIGLAALRGRDVPTAMTTLVLFLPSYACALAAVVPVSILNRLGRRLVTPRSSGATSSCACWDAAGWAKCGWGAISCWRAAPRSSWCGPRCSARAPRRPRR